MLILFKLERLIEPKCELYIDKLTTYVVYSFIILELNNVINNYSIMYDYKKQTNKKLCMDEREKLYTMIVNIKLYM